MEEFLDLIRDPWVFLVVGYVFTISIEAPVLYLGLSAQHPPSMRLFAGVWLTACTYPIVVLVVPEIFSPHEERLLYLLVAESIAHFGECLLFYLVFRPLRQFWRDMIAVFMANLLSFAMGELIWWIVLPVWQDR
jgi:hypothetical protein